MRKYKPKLNACIGIIQDCAAPLPGLRSYYTTRSWLSNEESMNGHEGMNEEETLKCRRICWRLFVLCQLSFHAAPQEVCIGYRLRPIVCSMFVFVPGKGTASSSVVSFSSAQEASALTKILIVKSQRQIAI